MIRADDHSFVDDLGAHYRRSGFHAESVGGGMIEVARPQAAARARNMLGLRVDGAYFARRGCCSVP
jgi:hypothetical protein